METKKSEKEITPEAITPIIVEENIIVENEITPESENPMMTLRTEDLVKKYRQRTVVNHVSINVKQGEIVGLLGPNGAGKTTTFYMAVGLVTPNEGRIFLNDLDITKFPVYKRAQHGIAYLAQEASVFRKMSVEDNILYILQMTGESKTYQKEKLESLIAEFRLQKVQKSLDKADDPRYNKSVPRMRSVYLVN